MKTNIIDSIHWISHLLFIFLISTTEVGGTPLNQNNLSRKITNRMVFSSLQSYLFGWFWSTISVQGTHTQNLSDLLHIPLYRLAIDDRIPLVVATRDTENQWWWPTYGGQGKGQEEKREKKNVFSKVIENTSTQPGKTSFFGSAKRKKKPASSRPYVFHWFTDPDSDLQAWTYWQHATQHVDGGGLSSRAGGSQMEFVSKQVFLSDSVQCM